MSRRDRGRRHAHVRRGVPCNGGHPRGDRDQDGGKAAELIDATMFRAELASQVVSVALFHRLAAKGKGLRTLRAVANKSGRLTEGERRAGANGRLAKWLEAVENARRFRKTSFLEFAERGSTPRSPGGADLSFERRFVSEVLRAAAFAVRDVRRRSRHSASRADRREN